LLSVPPSRETLNQIGDLAREHEGVLGVHDIIRSIRDTFAERFPEMRTIVKAEPKYVYSPVVEEEEADTP